MIALEMIRLYVVSGHWASCAESCADFLLFLFDLGYFLRTRTTVELICSDVMDHP